MERTTRFTMLLHLPRMKGHGTEARIKNGPALAGHGAEALYQAITRTITTLPEQLKRSLTWDQGAEMAQHARLTIDAFVTRVMQCACGFRAAATAVAGVAVESGGVERQVERIATGFSRPTVSICTIMCTRFLPGVSSGCLCPAGT